MHLLALPHIIASEPSALKMRIEKSASASFCARLINTKPSLPMPKCGVLHRCAANSGLGITYFCKST